VRSQLLSDFSPDDMCPMSTQFFESPVENSSSGPHETDHHEEVYALRVFISPTFHAENMCVVSTGYAD
jgi:hypothetical protein